MVIFDFAACVAPFQTKNETDFVLPFKTRFSREGNKSHIRLFGFRELDRAEVTAFNQNITFHIKFKVVLSAVKFILLIT